MIRKLYRAFAYRIVACDPEQSQRERPEVRFWLPNDAFCRSGSDASLPDYFDATVQTEYLIGCYNREIFGDWPSLLTRFAQSKSELKLSIQKLYNFFVRQP